MKKLFISILAISILFSLAFPLYAIEIEDSCMKGEPFTYGMLFEDDKDYKITADLGMDLKLDIIQMLEGQSEGTVVGTVTESGIFAFRPTVSGYYIFEVTNSSDNVRTFNITIEEEPASKYIE